MKATSLSLRLILLACLSISVALATLAFVFNSLFYSYFEERMYSELDQHLKQLTANLSFDNQGNIFVTPLPDPRFNLPFSGLYWQAQEINGQEVFSKSLWTSSIDIPVGETPGQQLRTSVVTNLGVPLLTLSWTILLNDETEIRSVTLSVAIDETEVQEAAAGFRTTILKWLALIFAGLIAAAWVQVRLGLAPLEDIRKKVGKIRAGDEFKLEGTFPNEVQPLADEVNELLERHNTSLASARDRASDLAHGLKTPLTVMLTLALDLRTAGQDEIADEIETQVSSMRYYIERELARVRTQSPAGIQTDAAPVVHKMVSTIRRFPRDEPLDWQVEITEELRTPFDEHDFSELLGNIFDNARKWAKSRVRVIGKTLPDGSAEILIEDDGPGVPNEMLPSILARGERLDPDVQGTGLGLAICADMIESYGAEFILDRSSLGGLAVTIRWKFD